MMTRLESAYNIIEIGKQKEIAGDLRRAHMAFEAAIRDFMHLSFTVCATVDEVKDWLIDHPLELAASKYVEITKTVLQMPQSEWGRYFQSGNSLIVSYSHFFAAIGEHERANFLAQTAAEPALFGTVFWAEYAKTLWALMQGNSYCPEFGKLHKIEQDWLNYVELMQAGMRHDSTDTIIAAIDRQFAIRNSKKWPYDDPYMIDGDAEFPVKFDFRKAGIQAVIGQL